MIKEIEQRTELISDLIRTNKRIIFLLIKTTMPDIDDLLNELEARTHIGVSCYLLNLGE